jgi:hypothetical protein
LSQTTSPDFSDVPTEGPNQWEVGNEGKTPADVVSMLLGGDYKEIISVIMRTNFEKEECMVIVRTLKRAKYGLGLIIKEGDKEWAMPWLRDAVVHLAMSRMSTDFHSVNKAVDALSSMRNKTEQQIKMSNL